MTKLDVRKYSKLLIFTVAILLISAIALKAQTTTPALVLHPTNIDIPLQPGTPKTGNLYLMNNTKSTITVTATARNFTAQGEQGGVAFTKEEIPFSLASWIKITPEKTDIPSGKEAVFTYAINPPANAEAGGHFGSIIFATVPSATTKGTGSSVSQEIASLILARIPGDVKEQATIESFKAQHSFYEYGPVTFDLRVKNEGGVHVRPAGVVTLTNTFGQKSTFGFEGLNVLPGATRLMPAIWDTHWLIGKYTANLALAYGSKNTNLYASTEFYAFPWKIGLVILFVLMLVLVARKRIFRAIKIMLKG